MSRDSDVPIKLLDGGLACQIITQGYELIDKDPLWSAMLLHSAPDAVKCTQVLLSQMSLSMHVEDQCCQISCVTHWTVSEINEALHAGRFFHFYYCRLEFICDIIFLQMFEITKKFQSLYSVYSRDEFSQKFSIKVSWHFRKSFQA